VLSVLRLQTTGKNVVAAAVGAADPALGEKAKTERSWRHGYVKHFVNGVKLSAVGRDEALKVISPGFSRSALLSACVEMLGMWLGFVALGC
jgi:hypothetical protein